MIKLKTITPVSTEPITLSEVKKHLRLDSNTFSDNLVTYQSIVPASHSVAGSYSKIGSSVSVLGKIAIVNLNTGLCNGTLNVKIQESDDDSTYTDWTGGAFTQVTTSNDNAIQEKEYTGSKQYIRVVANIASAACEFGVDILVDSGQSTEDDLISAWITTVREYAEKYIGKSLATQTLELMLDEFPNTDYIELPRSPLQSVTSVKYKNSAGVETTLTANTNYIVDSDSEVGRIVLPYGATWSTFTAYTVNPIRIRYVAGYTTDIPKGIKQGLLFHVGLLNKYRDVGIPDIDIKTLNNLYYPYRVRGIIY